MDIGQQFWKLASEIVKLSLSEVGEHDLPIEVVNYLRVEEKLEPFVNEDPEIFLRKTEEDLIKLRGRGE